MPKLNLSRGNFKWIAKQLHPDLEPEMIMAFSKVECKREPFDSDGFPAILYERHVFYRNVVDHHGRRQAKEWAEKYPTICASKGYGRGGYGSYAGQRKKFSKAFALCNDCAMEACSWGPFQELGENWEDYGFQNVGKFVDTMKDGLYGACIVFIRSIKARGLVVPMLNHRYATIAEKYNGKGYKQFAYDKQIQEAFEKAKNEGISWSKVKMEEPPRANRPVEITKIVESDSDDVLVDVNHQAPVVDVGDDESDENPVEPKVAIEKPVTENFLNSVRTELGILTGSNVSLDGVVAKAEQVQLLGLPSWFWFLLIGIIAVTSISYIVIRWKKHKEKEQRDLELTNQLVAANSTSDNKVVFFAKDEADKFEALGYKLVWR